MKQSKLAHLRISSEDLNEELLRLEQKVETLRSPVVFCHNDLLSGNIIYNKELNECHFIDVEYSCYSYRGFDIANHFCEFAGFDGNWDKYPTDEYQLRWLSHYFGINEAELDPELLHEISVFSLAAHLNWAIWALVQAEISNLEFDYLEYAAMRLEQYSKKKVILHNYMARTRTKT